MNRSIATAIVLLAFALPARSDPGYYVVTVYPDAGRWTADFRYWTVRYDGRPEVIWPELGLGYGVTDRWYTELFASWIDSSRMTTRLSSWNWQNDWLLTQGEYPIDVALHLQIIHDVDKGNAIEFGPVLQTDIERTQLNFNLFGYRERHDANSPPTELRYQWQLRHRTLPGLHLGLQGFGELGPWNNWLPSDRQSHRAGPAVFGKVPLGHAAEWHVQAAMLYGKVSGRDARMFTLRIHARF